MIDYENASDEELKRALAALEAGEPVQPVNAQTGQPLNPAQSQTAASIAAQGGYRPGSVPGGPAMPRAQMSPADKPPEGEFYIDPQGQVQQAPVSSSLGEAAPGFVNDALRSFSRGIPVAGSWMDELDAKSNAFLAPALEPGMKWLSERGVPTGYDPKYALAHIEDPNERYQAALMMQRQMDESFDEAQPGLSTGLKVGGTVAGLGAGVLGAGSTLVPISSRLAAGSGMLPQIGAGMAEGMVGGAIQGGGEGTSSDERIKNALMYGAGGGVLGGAAPVVMHGAGSGVKWAAGRLRDARAGSRPPVPATDPERLAAAIRSGIENADMPQGLRPPSSTDSADAAIREILAMREQAPPMAVPASAEDDAYARIVRAMTRQRQTPDEVVARVQDTGPFGMVADTGEAMRNLTRDAANRPSGAEDIIRQALEGRQRGVYDAMAGDYSVRPSSMRIMDAAESGMGLGGRKYHAEFDALDAAQKAAADPLYAQVRELGPTYSPRLQDLERRPSIKRAKARAYRLAAEEGRNPEALGLSEVEVPGAWDSEVPPTGIEGAERAATKGPAKAPSRGASLAKYIADNGGLTDTGGDLAAMDATRWHKGKAFQKPLIGKGGGADDWAVRAWEKGYFTGDQPPTQAELLSAIKRELSGKPIYAREADEAAAERFARREAAEEALYRGGYNDAPTPDDYVGRPEPQVETAWQTEPTAETWDYIKRGLDDELETYRDKTTGKLVLDGEGRNILRTLNELRGELVNLNPIYGEALDAYAGPASMKDALQMGRDALSEDAPDLTKRLADMSTSERDMYRLGALQALKDKLGNSDVTFDAARRAGLLKPNQLERFKELFPTRESFASYVRQMEREQTMFQTRSAALGNSSTAKQLLAAQDNDESGLSQAISAGVSAKTGGLPTVINFLKTWGGERKMSEPTAEALAQILTNMDQGALPVVQRRLTDAQAAQQVAEQIRLMSLTGGRQAVPTAMSQRDR